MSASAKDLINAAKELENARKAVQQTAGKAPKAMLDRIRAAEAKLNRLKAA